MLRVSRRLVLNVRLTIMYVVYFDHEIFGQTYLYVILNIDCSSLHQGSASLLQCRDGQVCPMLIRDVQRTPRQHVLVFIEQGAVHRQKRSSITSLVSELCSSNNIPFKYVCYLDVRHSDPCLTLIIYLHIQPRWWWWLWSRVWSRTTVLQRGC